MSCACTQSTAPPSARSINGASRPINTDEASACRDNGVEFIEVPVAFDGIAVVVHPDNSWASEITTTARLSDAALMAALGTDGNPAAVSAVRSAAPVVASQAGQAGLIFDSVRRTVAAALEHSRAGRHEAARQAAFDAYLVFEQVERTVRTRDASIAGDAEAAFATLRATATKR